MTFSHEHPGNLFQPSTIGVNFPAKVGICDKNEPNHLSFPSYNMHYSPCGITHQKNMPNVTGDPNWKSKLSFPFSHQAHKKHPGSFHSHSHSSSMASCSSGFGQSSSQCPPPPGHGHDPYQWVDVRSGRHGAPLHRPALPKPVMQLPQRILNGVGKRQVGQVTQTNDGASQVLIEIRVCTTQEDDKILKVLIDTGAQLNIVKRGIFSDANFQLAKNPLQLALANGQPFWGGDRELHAHLIFGKNANGTIKPMRLKASLYEAEIKADMILGLPWLAENHLDVWTHEKCLGVREKNGFAFPVVSCPDPPPLMESIDTGVRLTPPLPRSRPRWGKPQPPWSSVATVGTSKPGDVRPQGGWAQAAESLQMEADQKLSAMVNSISVHTPPLEVPTEFGEPPDFFGPN